MAPASGRDAFEASPLRDRTYPDLISEMVCSAVVAWVIFAIVAMLATAALAHDVYTGVKEGLSPAGRLCCGGDPVTGDCEAVDYRMLPSGDAMILSRRYGGAQVLIAKDRIQWFAVPGGEAFEAHWCGRPRTTVYTKIDALDPDPAFSTFCIFIRPGGV